MKFAVALLTFSWLAFSQQGFDLILKGGHVIDPRNGVDAVRDVAIRGGRIAAVEPGLPAGGATRTIDVSGLYVTPGLVDIHVHVFWGPRHGVTADGDHCVQPDAVGFRAGVTTMVDAGSAGWRDFPEFRRRVIDTAQTRVLAMINIVGVGMLGEDDAVDQNQFDMNPQLVADMARRNADVVVAIKSAHWRQKNFISVEKAVEAGNLANLPVMVDFGYFDKPYQVLVTDKLRSGDISTHFYRWPAPLLDANGKVAEYLYVARKRGVKFDVGHGGGSFHFPNAEPLVRQGFWPDSISTDLHSGSINGAMINMLNVMSKFLALGVPLSEVIRESTSNPALEIRRPQLGHIGVGADADVAVLRLEHGKFGYVDVKGGRIEGSRRLGCEMTLRGGKIVFDFNGRAGVPWRGANLDYPVR
ncbi:MAG TPA: amidohydrolase/deacetylase family metallohydrolase [Bryobacteraceae bacterium]|nr:amidohydrolase/deacetylase family metallohydrolase [Bryobacteraceae bacterium]